MFQGSLKIIAAIFSNGNFILRCSDKNTNSKELVQFVDDIRKYIRSKSYYTRKMISVTLDNAAYHRSDIVVRKLKEVFHQV